MKLDKNDQFILKEIILEHYQNPLYQESDTSLLKKNKVFFNSSCGDEISFQIKIKNDFVENISFFSRGCALSIASTDILCGQIIHQNLTTSLEILTNFYNLITGKVCNEDQLGELMAFWTLPQHVNRVNCVLLGVNALKEIIWESQGEKNGKEIKTNRRD